MTREEAIQILSTRDAHGVLCGYTSGVTEALDMAIEALKAEPMWITDRKPTESGRYMATVDSLGWIHVVIFRYGKPSMTNRKVKGMCWYYPDDEWGDVVYDDDEILAWMPLPTPYGERREP